MIKLHPAIVHFPIAFLAVAGVLAIVSLFTKREILKGWILKSLVAGLTLLPAAIIAGLVEQNQITHNDAIHSVLTIHKFTGLAIFLLYTVLTVWLWKRKDAMNSNAYVAFVLCLLVGTGLVLYQGYLGGKMVFELGAGVKPMEKYMEDNHHHGGENKTAETHEHDEERHDDHEASSDTTSHSNDRKEKKQIGHDKHESSPDTLKKKKLKGMKY